MKLKKLKTKLKNGYTFVELMTAIAVVSIMSAIAIPSYRDYNAKVQMVETAIFANYVKKLVEEHMIINGEPPNSLTAMGYPNITGAYVNDIAFWKRRQTFYIQLGGDGKSVAQPLRWQELYMTYEENEAGGFDWKCTSTVKQKYLPSFCTEGPELFS